MEPSELTLAEVAHLNTILYKEGPSEASRLERITGIPAKRIEASVMQWLPRPKIEGPGRNYVVRVY